MPLENSRRLRDALLSVNVALPNAGNTVTTNSLDLGVAKPFPVTEKFHVKLAISAAAGANNKNISARIQDSADGTNFANIAELGTLTVTDNNGGGYPAGSITVMLPPSTRRYIRGVAAGEANGGNAGSNGTLTLEPVF